jgi:hypothetical protein
MFLFGHVNLVTEVISSSFKQLQCIAFLYHQYDVTNYSEEMKKTLASHLGLIVCVCTYTQEYDHSIYKKHQFQYTNIESIIVQNIIFSQCM